MPTHELNRRRLLKGAAASGVALVLPCQWQRGEAAAAPSPLAAALIPNAFLIVKPDNTIMVLAKHLEMGQGVHTGLATLVAEELDADWRLVQVTAAAANPVLYRNLLRGQNQMTGGSTSMANSWLQLRTAGAQARGMLVAAAAATWQVPVQTLQTADSRVTHPASGRSLTYGELVAKARQQSVPPTPQLKTRGQFRLIGRADAPRVDSVAKTDGSARFAMDVRLPGRLVALLARPPTFGATLKAMDAKAAWGVAGVRDIVTTPRGVAIIADQFWAAKQARDSLVLTWDETSAFRGSTDDLKRQYQDLLGRAGDVALSVGQVAAAEPRAARTLDATFTLPFLAHAPMEPLNCVIKVGPKSCELWSGSQSPTRDQAVAAKILGLLPENVVIHTMLAGGSFGRRSNPTSDYVAEAAEIAKASKLRDRPIHLMWTREDDLRGGYYRPFTMHRVVAGVTAKGEPAFWRHRIATQSIRRPLLPKAPPPGDIDPTSVEGADKIPYAVAHRQLELHTTDLPIPVLWWRSVGHNHTAFVVESVIDELASLAGRDPVAYRLALLKDQARHRAVLERVAHMAAWGRTLPPQQGLGVAVHASFGSVVAEVAQVSVTGSGYRVDKVWCAIDCGLAINPDVIRAQMEGSIGFALSALQREAIHLAAGKVVESNFHDYRPLRLSEMPEVTVAILESADAPTGVGEPGVPPLAPAVANALAKVTGKRLRELPLRLGG